ncbi:MAG: rhombosortase [Colwellia sp.]|nr:rhombosortase [Colwellia sp.]MCW8866460.1 rhombosortase [Colwellia sp.]MCW9083202.1 rhombosortase [Colwellia sp.]
MKLTSLPLAPQQYTITGLIALIAIFIFIAEQVIGSTFTDILVYQRQLIGQGEIWRLFTGHFLHTNSYHLLLNLAALVLLWLLHGRFYSRSKYSLLFVLSALTTSLGMYYFTPELQQYVGLSGVLHGVFVFGAVMDICANDKTGYLLFIGVWLKIIHEQVYGASADVSALIEASVAVDAHLWGALGGLLFSMIYLVMPNGINDDLPR